MTKAECASQRVDAQRHQPTQRLLHIESLLRRLQLRRLGQNVCERQRVAHGLAARRRPLLLSNNVLVRELGHARAQQIEAVGLGGRARAVELNIFGHTESLHIRRRRRLKRRRRQSQLLQRLAQQQRLARSGAARADAAAVLARRQRRLQQREVLRARQRVREAIGREPLVQRRAQRVVELVLVLVRVGRRRRRRRRIIAVWRRDALVQLAHEFRVAAQTRERSRHLRLRLNLCKQQDLISTRNSDTARANHRRAGR